MSAGSSSSANGTDAGPVMRALLRLRDQAGINIAVVLIANGDAGGGGLLLQQLACLQAVHFPQYGEGEMRALLLQVGWVGGWAGGAAPAPAAAAALPPPQARSMPSSMHCCARRPSDRAKV